MHTAINHSRQSPARPFCGVRWRLQVWLLAGLLMWFVPAARAESSKEYQIKAAFLYNFTQFVDWPTNAFTDANAPLTIGILGNDPFGNALEDIVRGEKTAGHALIVKHFQSGDTVTDCQILFICQSEAKRLSEILEDVKGRNILTVGESEGFAQSGGMIRFITEKNKIRLRINVDATRAADLNLSAKLLRLAEIVGGQKE